MNAFDIAVRLVYLAAATCFVVGLHLMNSPVTAKRGNLVSAVGMGAAIAATLVLAVASGTVTLFGWLVLAAGIAVGSGAGLLSARRVPMTAMPQLVSLFNAVGGGAAALVGVHDFTRFAATQDGAPPATAIAVVLDVFIGAIAFSGSLVACGKLQGWIPGRPILPPARGAINALLLIVIVIAAAFLLVGSGGSWVLAALVVAALTLGVLATLPVGGADMPVVVSLLNACTGIAVAMAGFVIGNSMLIIAGGLVGASGGILTKLMADAMNRPVTGILAGGYGTGDTTGVTGGPGDAQVRSTTADDAAIQLAYASRVMIVPGYGLAAAQAQHEVHELAELLASRGVAVGYAIHPVAGRMPGHMNVLLAEAKVPYEQMKEMEDANREFARTDVALVIGANDVTNPAARAPGNAISGMPILDVDHAAGVLVVKRSMGHGYAGLDNPLYSDPKTRMYFADAKTALADLTAAVKTLVR